MKSNECVAKSDCFDESFYIDQKTTRKQVMYLSKVTKEYAQEENARKKREAAKQRRKELAYADFRTEDPNKEVEIEVDEDDSDCEESEMKSQPAGRASNVCTRSSKKGVSDRPFLDVCSAKNSIPSVPLRKEGQAGSGTYAHILPRYLKAMSLLMAENLSASEAVKVVYICDTVIWKQVRHLPLRLEKQYMNAYKRLKVLRGSEQKEEESEPNLEDVGNDVSEQVSICEQESIQAITIQDESEEENSQEISNLKQTIQSFIDIRKRDKGNVLPDPNCVRQNHNLLSVYCERKIADEIVAKKAFIIPDGTSRQGVGDMAAAVVKVGDHVRALKATKIGKGDRENWAAAIYHMLNRLATASSRDIGTIWKSIVAMLSDLCKVNLHLANEVKKAIGVEWVPGQIFCNLHYTLAIPEGIKKVLTTYQCLIGASKLFPKNVSFEMNVEDKLIVIQVLDCWMRLTSIRWQSRPWNRYSDFTEFAERRGIKNVGHMMHSNRFGEFEERCAGGVYLSETWKEWLSTFVDVRNQLACYLRSILSIMDMCKFLWTGAALIGLHVTAPFMSMLLDHKVTPLTLLEVLPQLYNDLLSYPQSLAQLNECGVPSMKKYFLYPLQKETSPYGVEVCKYIVKYLEECDMDLMNRYLSKICNQLAIILKRQRGDQYGFGDNPDTRPTSVKHD